MAREFWEVARALVRLAPESPEAFKFTGGVILRDLTDDECRDGHIEAMLFVRHNERPPLHVRLRANEYSRRLHAGTLEIRSPEEGGRKRSERHDLSRPDLVALSDDEVRKALTERRRLRAAGQPVPADVARVARECELRWERGAISLLPAEERALRARRGLRAARTARAEVLPPPPERQARRFALGLSVSEVAARIGVSEGSVRDWEQGRYVPRSPAALGAYVQLLQSACLTDSDLTGYQATHAERREVWTPDRIRALRCELRLTQRELAALLGIAGGTVSNWESGRQVPTARWTTRMASLATSHEAPVLRQGECYE